MAIKFIYECTANSYFNEHIYVYKYSFKSDKEAIKEIKKLFNIDRINYICKVLNECTKMTIFKNEFYKPLKNLK